MRSHSHRTAAMIVPLARVLAAAALMVMLALDSGRAQSFSIAATVNDEPISAWDVDQRVKFYQATTGGDAADALRKRALDELVEELLITQEARRLSVTIDEQTIRGMIEDRLRPLNRSYAQFKQYLGGRGVDVATLENQIRTQLQWSRVIAQTYRGQVSIDESEIEEAAGEIDSETSGDTPETFVLQRIVLEVPDGADDAAFVRRMEEAERIREDFIDCNRNKTSLKRYSAVVIEDMPDTTAESLAEPTQSLVLQAASGQVTPPNVIAGGVEFYAVCERRADGGRRKVAERQLLNQELGMLASRHLRDLRQDAVVEFR